MPVLIETALLTECTYKITESDIESILRRMPNWRILKEYSSLTREDESSSSTGTVGYLGRSYINPVTKEIMLVHRGTKLNQTSRGCTDDLINDSYLATKFLPPYAELALECSRDCVMLRETDYPDYQLYQVGHSLGGALAHICGVQLQLPVIAFDPPGCETIIKALNVANLDEQLRQHHTFLVQQNVTNAVDNHLGCLHYLGVELRTNDSRFFKSVLDISHHKMLAIIKKIEDGQCAQFDPFSAEEFRFIEANIAEEKRSCIML